MVHVVVLSLADRGESDGPGSCAAAGRPRAGVLACREALQAGGASVELAFAGSDSDIDTVLDQVTVGDEARLVVAMAAAAQLRAVVRRMVRRYAPAPSTRPADLPSDRTIEDLPPVGVLPLAVTWHWPGVPQEPAEVATATLGGRVRRLDLLRNDAGSVTLDGALLGGADGTGRPVPFQARVEVDDALLSSGDEPLLSVAVLNADGYARVDDLPLVTGADPADGSLDVAVALPAMTRTGWRRRPTIEVRRARGRAVAVHPAGTVPFVDDGVAGELTRSRTWWLERAAFGLYVA